MKKQERNNHKKEYEALLESGDLLVMFPWLKGSWEEDKEEINKIFNSQFIDD